MIIPVLYIMFMVIFKHLLKSNLYVYLTADIWLLNEHYKSLLQNCHNVLLGQRLIQVSLLVLIQCFTPELVLIQQHYSTIQLKNKPYTHKNQCAIKQAQNYIIQKDLPRVSTVVLYINFAYEIIFQ